MKKIVILLLTFGLVKTSLCQKTIPQKLDELMTAYCKVNKFNGTVLVSQKGKILLAKGYGIRNAQTQTLNDIHSIFQTYSITKSFTSTVTLKLVELKKIALSDKLSKFYPEFPKGDSITIEHLLTHTSGLYDYTRGNNMPDQTESSFIKFLAAQPLDFSPGTGWNYSNSGYWLIGFIISQVTGISYEEAVKKYIFQPLHMSRSGFDFKYLADTNKTIGYRLFSENNKKEAVVYDPPAPYAAGAIYSTVGDLYKFYKGLKSFSLLKEESLKKAYTPFKNNYGYGWIIGAFEGRRQVSHSGGAAGYRSNFLTMPEDDICIILLNNNENAAVELITKNLCNILFDKPYKLPSAIKLAHSTLAKFTGAFSVKPGFTLYITQEDGRLMAQPSGQPKTILLAERENYFFAEEPNSFLEFIKDETGSYTAVMLHPAQGGESLKAARIYPVWGLAGTATLKGWEENIPDIHLTEHTVKKGLWELKDITLKKGVFVFRLNNDWGYHYGDNEKDTLLDMYGKDIEVEAGIYDITLDLTDETQARYILSKKE